MLRKVKLYGQLAEFIGHKEFEVKVSNVSQAVSFLIHNFPNVESYMSPKYYQVKVGNYDIEENEVESTTTNRKNVIFEVPFKEKF